MTTIMMMMTTILMIMGNMLPNPEFNQHAYLLLFSVNKSEKTDFLNHFYKHCMHGKFFLNRLSVLLGLRFYRNQQRLATHTVFLLILFDNELTSHFKSVFIAPLLSNTGAGSPEKTDSCTVQVDLVPGGPFEPILTQF